MRYAVLLTALGLALAACAGSAGERNLYLLRADAPERAGRLDAPLRVGLGRVSVAPYLDRAGIVVETESRQVQAARLHQWAEPLESGVRSLLRAELSRALGYEVSGHRADGAGWDVIVDVHVDQLHGTMQGTALLEAGYRISARAGEPEEFRFSRSVALPREGYPGVVDAEAELVRQLARAIADGVRGAGAGP